MSTLSQRIFAASGAILFFLTSAALTIVVVFTMVHDKSSQNNAQTASNQQSCQDTSQNEPTFPAPDAYKPDGKVDKLQTTDLEAGSGKSAESGDCLVMKYYGTLASDGTVFDENFTKPTAFAFVLGQGQVIPGWDQGLVGMKAGGTRRLVIPSNMAYGSQGNSSIPPNADLVFVVKLLRIQK